MSASGNSFEVGIHFASILRALSKEIYETPHAFIRENVQNAVDAVRIQASRDKLQPCDERYCIDISVNDLTVTVRDKGIGMSKADLQNYFWTIGASGKRSKEAQDAGCVGMFGIGGFANFGVCDTLEVTSQTAGEEIGTLTRLSTVEIKAAGVAIPSVTVEESVAASPRGTVVVGQLRKAPNAAKLKTYLRDFVRYVPIVVKFNGEKISQQRFAELTDRTNLTPIGGVVETWHSGNIAVVGRLFQDRGYTLVAAIEGLAHDGKPIELTGQLRFESGSIDVFKRGFKLCATTIPSTIGISGRLDCDLFVPTAGRDSLDAATASLLGQIGALLETEVIDAIFDSPERIAQHTRVFRLILKRGLIDKLDNVSVRLADGHESALSDINRRANEGGVGVYFGTTKNQALNQVMQARGHIVVQLSSDRHRQQAEKQYLETYCAAKPFDGMIDCTEVYADLTRFERVFLSEIEQNIHKSYEVKNFSLIPGRLSEDIPALVKEHPGSNLIEIFVDVRHGEVTKLERLGFNQLLYSLISMFCRDYIGPSVKKWSPRFFGDGALNLELFSKRRSEVWVLIKDDIGVIRRLGQHEVVTQKDVTVFSIGGAQVQAPPAKGQTHRLLQIIDEDDASDLAGYYIRLPDMAFRAYGDLLPDCDSRGVVWTGNKMTFSASDGVSAQFQYEIRLDEIVAGQVDGALRVQGALDLDRPLQEMLDLDRPLQEMYDGVYFPIPSILERFLVPMGDAEIRLDLHCEWIDMRTSKLWEAETPTA